MGLRMRTRYKKLQSRAAENIEDKASVLHSDYPNLILNQYPRIFLPILKNHSIVHAHLFTY